MSLEKAKFGDGVIFQKHNQYPQMQSRLPDLVIMHHMCIQSMHAYEKQRQQETEREQSQWARKCGSLSKNHYYTPHLGNTRSNWRINNWNPILNILLY